jgi:hypothetical protein
MDPQSQVDISKLSETDKKELNQILSNEAQKSNIQQSKCLSRLAFAMLCRDALARRAFNF